MGWVRLDDGFPQHPKVVTLSDEAFRAYVVALCYAAEYETDGFVPEVVAVNGPVREALVTHGLWDDAEGGIAIHDYLEFNPSREEKRSIRDSRRLAGAIGAATRYADSKGVGAGAGGSKDKKESLVIREGFDLFWSAYPRKVGKRTAEAAFAQATKRAGVTEVIAGAERLRDDPNLPETRYIPHPTTWLRRDGWEDAPYPSRGGGRDRARKALEKARDRGSR